MKLALGTVQFGLDYGITNQTGQVSPLMAAQIMSVAREHHIDVIDTAASYGDSEFMLGRIGVQGFRVVTKLPPLPDMLDDVGIWAKRQLSNSLDRLRVKSIHGLLLHRGSDLLGPQGRDLFRALRI